jgi:hypothetical protein
MSLVRRAAALAAIGTACLAGCKRQGLPASPDAGGVPGSRSPDATSDRTAEKKASPGVLVGVKAPFERLDRASAKTLRAAQAAFRAKRYDAARDLFHELVTAHPDQTLARYEELRSAVLFDPNADIRDRWRQLLARDFIGYSKRLETRPEFAPLRKSAQWAELLQITTDVKGAYTAGLEHGFFFVARSRPAEPQLYDEKGRPVLELFQEAYHFDVAQGRVRRLTDSGGRVFGILADRSRKQLLLLLVEGLQNNELDTGWRFSIFRAAVLSLEALDQPASPTFPEKGAVSEIRMCISEKGTPLWITKTGYTLDPARKKLVSTTEACPSGSGVKVTTRRGEHIRPPADGVSVGVARTTLTIDGSYEIQRKEYVATESIGWSAAKTRLVWAGDFDPCRLDMYHGEDWPPSARTEFLMWDRATKKTTLLAEAFSHFDWEWLDDDHLAHETGSKTSPRVAVYELSSRTETTIETYAGAGLVSVPSFECPIPLTEGP